VPISLSAEGRPRVPRVPARLDDGDHAVIRPVVERYLERIEGRLADAGIAAKLLVMQSSGGVFGSAAAAAKPVFMVESGPAAGVIAAAYLGETLGRPDILSFDMGGTTAKVGLIQGGRPSVTKDYNVGGHAGAGIGGLSLSGYRCGRRSSTSSRSVRAAARSRGSTRGGLLRVGPRSAGADPAPSVTGAAAPSRPSPMRTSCSGGSTPVTSSAARWASTSRERATRSRNGCAKPLGLDVTKAAYGIVEIANAAMVNALHLISVQRGYDPRDFVLVGFGGAGPCTRTQSRATRRCRRCSSAQPGIFSATGLLTTDLKRDAAVTIMRRLDEVDGAEGRGRVRPARARRARGVAPRRARRRSHRVPAPDRPALRRQSYELTIPPATACSSASTPSTTASTASPPRRRLSSS